jgi:signal transduction histidine kinase
MSPLPPPASATGASGRETHDVNAFPPPPPPPGAGGGPVSRPNSDWDRERVQELAKRWFQPLLEREGWMAALYLFVGLFSAVGFFIALNVVGWVTFGLMFAGVGFLLVRPFFSMVEALCRAERGMARWVGVEIEARPLRPMTGLGLQAATDPERWRLIGFLAINVVFGTAIGNLGLAAYGLIPNVAFEDPTPGGGWWFGLGGIGWLIGLALAVLLLGAAPRIAKFVARFKAHVTAWFLGVDQLAEAQQRVTALSTQRQDILDAVASERRRIERNLHDGVQQQLVAIGLDLGMAEQQIGSDPDRARELVVSARQKVQGSIGELRQLGRGLHPAILADRGIDAALSAVVAGSPIPISVHVDPGMDLSTDVAETVYFVANEAIANVLKHARARVASVHVTKVAANVRVTVHDDGQGGVDPSRGTGIAGIRARVHAVDGSLTISSPQGGPTTLVVEIPRHHPNRHHPSDRDRS